MPGLVPGIHVFEPSQRTWMAGHRRAEATPSFGQLCAAMTESVSIRVFRVRLLAGLDEVKALFDLAEQCCKILSLLHGEARQNLLFLAQQARNQFLVQRLALAGQAKAEFAAVVCILDTFHNLPFHQRGDGAANGRFMGPGALGDVLCTAGIIAETERRQHPPFRDVEPVPRLILAGQRGTDFGRQPVQAKRHEMEKVELSLAIDLAQRGQRVVLLYDADRIGEGSRAICFSKRSLEFWDRLGIGQRMVDKGVVWSVGKIFHGASQLYQFNLLPEEGHKRPAFINLQQFYAEAYLVDRVHELAGIDLRWRNKVVGLEQRNDHAVLTIETPDGAYRIRANYVVACDGARSSLRQMVGAEFAGKVFEDQFLIADVKMTAEFPTERWFWFDPPFHAGRSALLHKQPDDIWPIDLQLYPDT